MHQTQGPYRADGQGHECQESGFEFPEGQQDDDENKDYRVERGLDAAVATGLGENIQKGFIGSEGRAEMGLALGLSNSKISAGRRPSYVRVVMPIPMAQITPNSCL